MTEIIEFMDDFASVEESVPATKNLISACLDCMPVYVLTCFYMVIGFCLVFGLFKVLKDLL